MAALIFGAPNPNTLSLCTWISVAAIVTLVGRVLYRIYVHPLSRVPGPKLAASSSLYYLYLTYSGHLHSKIKELHVQYGDAVRLGPDMVVYKNASAWKDIYGHRKHGTSSFDKDPKFYLDSPSGPNILTSNDADHSRERRLLAHAFSERSLKEQEPLIRSYVDLLIEKLFGEVKAGRGTADMTKWYNYTTFDIIGDLAFGEPFNCLRDSEYHPWVSTIFQSVKSGAILRLFMSHQLLAPLVKGVIQASFGKKRLEQQKLSSEKARQRLETQTTRPDFITYILRYNDERGMTQREIESNANLLIVAGSETTATLLSGCTFFLLTNPAAYKRLIDEIRGTFQTSQDINFQSTAKLPYLHSVLEESLRLYPPVPGIIPRRVPDGGAMIGDQFVPGGTSVSVGLYSAFRAESNFVQPDNFIPERWMDNEDPKFASDNKEVVQAFSYGPRNCLGKNLAYAEMRLILASLVWNFDLSLRKDCFDWDDQLSYTVWQKNPLMVKLTPVQR